jgi:hypothetical protein
MIIKDKSTEDERPHVFLSYSWTSLDHQRSVEKLAEDLTESNIHVVFDLWDLKTSDDTIPFMERSINDPRVTKVLILADKNYVEKAVSRQGGVGTETQIISPSIYNSSNPGKFAVVVYERDENNKPYLPTYYKSRMYIDFSDPSIYAQEYEKLERWIFDKPAHVRPAYGKTPSFVLEPDALSLGTDTLARRVLDALHNGKSTSLGAFTEYLEICINNLGRFKLNCSESQNFDDLVAESIDSLKPFKNQLLSIINAVSVHTSSIEYGSRLHHFFENFYKLTQRSPDSIQGWHESDFDNFAFILHVSFNSNETVSSYVRFSVHGVSSLVERNRRLSLNKKSLQAELLVARTKDSLISEEDLLQIDFLLFLRSKLKDEHWYPTTYMYMRINRPLEVFARSASMTFYKKFEPILGALSLDHFKNFIGSLKGERGYGGAFAGSYSTLVGLSDLGSRP